MEMVMIESQSIKYCDSRNKSVSELAGCLTEDTKAQMQCLKIFSDTKQWLVLYFFYTFGEHNTDTLSRCIINVELGKGSRQGWGRKLLCFILQRAQNLSFATDCCKM